MRFKCIIVCLSKIYPTCYKYAYEHNSELERDDDYSYAVGIPTSGSRLFLLSSKAIRICKNKFQNYDI